MNVKDSFRQAISDEFIVLSVYSEARLKGEGNDSE